jgi:hypothetical protein
MLFDLSEDPGELRDVSRKNRDVVRFLRAQLESFEAIRPGGGALPALDDESKARLEALGYLQ